MILNNSRKAILSILFLLIVCPFKSNAQPILTNPFSGSYFQPSFGINAGTLINTEDFLFDFGLGLEEIGYDYSITFNGSFRPYRKTVLFEESNNLSTKFILF